MQDKKTIKQILEQLKEQERTPLYNSEALGKIRKALEHWRNTVVSEVDRDTWQITQHTVLGSDIPRSLLYTPLDSADLDYMEDIGFSGGKPYTRGIHANMYRGRKFTMRQLTGFGGPEDTNERIKFMLEHGATGVSIVFDLPTIQMYDSDNLLSEGQVGACGVSVDSVDDMGLLFKDIPLDRVSISLVTHYPSNTAILLSMFLVAAERMGVPWDQLNGSVQNDMTMEEVVRSSPEYIPPEQCFRVQCDNIEFIRKNIPRWNFITYNGYNLREYGTSAVTEMAVALANAIETLQEMCRRGYDIDWVAERLTFFWSIGNDFFEEIARLRAVRRLWHRIMKYKFNAKSPRSMWMRCHTQTSGVSLCREEPLNNIVRAAYHSLAAVLGGVQSLHVDSYDEAYSVPTEEAALLSLRTQEIIQSETGITEVVDPLGGSFYIEALANETERQILTELAEVEEIGGYVTAVADGVLHKKISEYSYQQQKLIEEGQIKIVGRNYLQTTTKSPDIDVFRYPEGVEERQKERLKSLKERRDMDKVRKCLNALRRACQHRDNIVPYCIDAARSGATEGEMFKIFKEAFGLWHPARV